MNLFPRTKLKPKANPTPKTNTKALDKTQDESLIQTFLDMIAPNMVKFEPDYFICGNTFRCCWALREYPTSTSEQAILQHLGEKAGVTLHIYTRVVIPAEERKIINLADKKTAWSEAQTICRPPSPLMRICRTWPASSGSGTATGSLSSTPLCTSN